MSVGSPRRCFWILDLVERRKSHQDGRFATHVQPIMGPSGVESQTHKLKCCVCDRCMTSVDGLAHSVWASGEGIVRSHNAMYIILRWCDNICAQCKGGWALESPRCERHVSCFVSVGWVLGHKSVRLRHKPNDAPACAPTSGKIRVVAGFDNLRRSRSRAFSYAAEVSYRDYGRLGDLG